MSKERLLDEESRNKLPDLYSNEEKGLEVELGYFALSELESVRSPLGLPVERDLYFEPKSLRELMEWHDQQRRSSP